ncbi:hypothetical protein ZEAMMB73_Zm00001d031949 [Zea mays]|uniref:Uncharacterized protein n=1 Tax=Zea mays TaxID=4577 RepID=A0A1D6KML5_MAIZE|nr:hypothetical protein ZEAMMB73_Zm00001d031949 [Zea mays]
MWPLLGTVASALAGDGTEEEERRRAGRGVPAARAEECRRRGSVEHGRRRRGRRRWSGGARRSAGETSADWDKAWSAFKKKGKRTLFSDFSPDKYVTWNPRRSEYPLSEEVDPIKRTERSNLMLWTSPQFTLVGAIIIVLTLLIYTLVVPPPK